MFCHCVLNMQETNYEMDPNEIILKISMIYGFEEMYDIHEAILALVHFFIHSVVMYILLYKCLYTYYTLFLCL